MSTTLRSILWAGAILGAGSSLAACGGPDDGECASGEVCVWAGTGNRGFNQDTTASRLDSWFYFPSDLTFGPDGRAYIADWNNHRIRRVNADDTLETVVGTDYEGDGAPNEEDRLPVGNAQGAPGTEVAMNHPTGALFGPDGLLYIAAWHNNKIRVWDPATGILKVLAGETYGFKGDGGPCYDALMNQPKSLAIASDGTIYTNDQRNVRIRKITPDHIINTIAGGSFGNTGDDGNGMQAQFGFDTGITPRPSGALVLVDDNMLYIADSANNRIRKLDLTTNIVTAVAGDPAGGAGNVDGIGADARFDFPSDMELGPEGLLYIADRFNNVIRTLDVTTGEVKTVIGNGKTCDSPTKLCTNGDRQSARTMQLHEPYGIAFDPTGNLYIADTHNNRLLVAPR